MLAKVCSAINPSTMFAFWIYFLPAFLLFFFWIKDELYHSENERLVCNFISRPRCNYITFGQYCQFKEELESSARGWEDWIACTLSRGGQLLSFTFCMLYFFSVLHFSALLIVSLFPFSLEMHLDLSNTCGLLPWNEVSINSLALFHTLLAISLHSQLYKNIHAREFRTISEKECTVREARGKICSSPCFPDFKVWTYLWAQSTLIFRLKTFLEVVERL